MPNTKIFGPVNYGFLGMWNLQTSYAAGRDFLNYYLSQMKAAELTYGKRLLDVLDVHWYPEVYLNGVASPNRKFPGGRGSAITGPRSLWDPTYDEESWVTESWCTNGPIKLLPTLQGKIDANYPDKIAVTSITTAAAIIFPAASPRPTCWASSDAKAYLPPASGLRRAPMTHSSGRHPDVSQLRRPKRHIGRTSVFCPDQQQRGQFHLCQPRLAKSKPHGPGCHQ